VNVTEKIKRDQTASASVTTSSTISSPSRSSSAARLHDVANLWPEPWNGDANAHQKTASRQFSIARSAAARSPLVEALRMIATDWLCVYRSRCLQAAL